VRIAVAGAARAALAANQVADGAARLAADLLAVLGLKVEATKGRVNKVSSVRERMKSTQQQRKSIISTNFKS